MRIIRLTEKYGRDSRTVIKEVSGDNCFSANDGDGSFMTHRIEYSFGEELTKVENPLELILRNCFYVYIPEQEYDKNQYRQVLYMTDEFKDEMISKQEVSIEKVIEAFDQKFQGYEIGWRDCQNTDCCGGVKKLEWMMFDDDYVEKY